MALPPPLPPTYTDCSCAAQLQQGSLEIDGDEAQGPGHTSHACSFTPTYVWLGDMLEDTVGFHRAPLILRPHGAPHAPWTLHGTVGQPTAQWDNPQLQLCWASRAALSTRQRAHGMMPPASIHASCVQSHCQQEADEHHEAGIFVRSKKRF